MKIQATTPEEYIQQAPDDRREALQKLRQTIQKHLPDGFEEGIQYGMIGYYVPHKLYPDGYHCNPKEPLPFMSFASQKNSINLYHNGMYADKNLHEWFVNEYPKHSKQKLDMGKSCVRFRKLEDIPYELLGELCQKITVKDWIALYERTIKK